MNTSNGSNQTITILTANQRLSAYLRKQYDTAQQSSGLITWQSLDCLPLNRWLLRTYDTLADQRLILTEAQELALWEKIITDDLSKNNDFILLRPSATAHTASEAWHLLKQWQLPLTLLKDALSEDIQYFYQWAETFQTICYEKQWLDHSDCANILIQALKTQSITLPPHLILSGFEEVPPQITQLCDTLADFTQIHWLQPGVSLLELLHVIHHNKNHVPDKIKTPLLKSIALLDTTHELQTMALWAKQALQKNPGITVGCVVPELNTLRAKVERIFTEVFTSAEKKDQYEKTTSSLMVAAHPYSTSSRGLSAGSRKELIETSFLDPADKPRDDGIRGGEQLPLMFNLSAGIPLHKYPLIRTALEILQLPGPELSLEQISSLLRSPFIGGAEQERTQRAILDIALRQPGERFLTLDNVLTLSKLQAQCPLWTQQLTGFAAVMQSTANLDITLKHLPSTWVHFFIQLLENLRWPGERTLNSAEFQQLQRWQSLLTEFTTLDLVINKPITYAAARDQLQRLAQHTQFQPQSDDAPVQVLGLLEATGMQFDRLWVMGMNDESWPKSAAPNPFIPTYLQRKTQMPHASAERELTFSQKLTLRFTLSAEQVIFSYSQHSGDTPLRKSALISAWDEMALCDVIETPPPPVYDPGHLEPIQDEQAPVVEATELIRGGASVLKDQAACAFRAFAKIRLSATRLPDITSGLSAMERGILLHEILEQVWKTLDNHNTLQRYDDAQLSALTQSIVIQVLSQKTRKRPLSLKKRFIAIETQRLTQLITEWLQLEKKRPFFRVIQRESAHKIYFAGLELSLRIDRVDELADGSRVIIDYKTGLPRVEDWFGERPDDPQLPLYCVTCEFPVHGLLFAQIRVNQSQFKGVSATETGIKGVKPISDLKAEYQELDWEQFQLRQQDILTRLTQDFLQGNAAVDPKKLEETCRNCELQMLCRIYDA